MKILKRLKYVVLGVVLLVIVGVVGVWLYLDHIVQQAVQRQATTSLNLKTDVGGASLSLFGGKLGLSDLEIASPQGFAAPHMLTLGKADIGVSYGQLRGDPVHVASVTLDRPMLVIEQVNGEFNFKKAADNLPPGDPKPQEDSKPLKLILDELTVKDAKVVLRPGIPGLPEQIDVPVTTFTMKNVGTGDGSQNGAAVKDVVMQVITALAAQAQSSGAIPAQLRELLRGNLASVVSRLGAEAQQRVLQAVPGEAGKVLSSILADPQSLTKDPGKAISGALGNALGGGGGGPATIPTTLPADPTKAAGDALKGLLGPKEKKDKVGKGK
jgi:hypothetical protein